MFLYFCLLGSFSSWMQGPLHSLLGWLGWPSAQSVGRVLGGDCGRAARSDLWGHDLGWCASGKIQLLLSESSRRKWWIWGIGRTGHLLALWSLPGSSIPRSWSAKSPSQLPWTCWLAECLKPWAKRLLVIKWELHGRFWGQCAGNCQERGGKQYEFKLACLPTTNPITHCRNIWLLKLCRS